MTFQTLESIVASVKSQASSAPLGTFPTYTAIPCSSVPGLHEGFSRVIEALGGRALSPDDTMLALMERDAEIRLYQPRINSSTDAGVLVLAGPGEPIVLDSSKIDWEAVSVSFEKDQDGVLNRAVFAVSYVADVEMGEDGIEEEVWDTFSLMAYLVEGATEVPAKAYKKDLKKLTSIIAPLVNRTISSKLPAGDNAITEYAHDSENDRYFIICGDNHVYCSEEAFKIVSGYPVLADLAIRVTKEGESTRSSVVNTKTGAEVASFGNKSLSSLAVGTYEGVSFSKVIRDGKEKFVLTIGSEKYSANTMLGKQIGSDSSLVEGETYVLDVRAKKPMKNGNTQVICVLVPATQNELMANIMKLVSKPTALVAA